jgi:hypothetical protein
MLTKTDATALAVLAKNLVDANERRNPEHEWATLNEEVAISLLKAKFERLANYRT